MSHFSGIWAEVERIYYLLSENDCPIWFADNAHMLDAAKWLVSKGIKVPPKEEDHVQMQGM